MAKARSSLEQWFDTVKMIYLSPDTSKIDVECDLCHKSGVVVKAEKYEITIQLCAPCKKEVEEHPYFKEPPNE